MTNGWEKKPSLFVGSSSEGLAFARAVRKALRADAEVSLWNEGPFQVGRTFIESLVNALDRFDFAVLVMTPDDLIEGRKATGFGPRDNVIFELGLFMGRLGQLRTFMLCQEGAELKIPTDLLGVQAALYQWPRDDRNYTAAVGDACDDIRNAIQSLGFLEKTSGKLDLVLSRQTKQEAEIRALTGQTASASYKADAALAAEAALAGRALVSPELAEEQSPEQKLFRLAEEYEQIRARQDPKDIRRAAMTDVVGKMLDLAQSLSKPRVRSLLRDRSAGKRMIAYTHIYALPNGEFLSELGRVNTNL